MRQIISHAERCTLRDGVLYHLWWPDRGGFRDDTRVQLAVPPELRTEVLKECHDSPYTGGHFGHSKTWHKLHERYWWPHMFADSDKWIKTCTICQSVNKLNDLERVGQMRTMMADYPGQKWVIDTLLVMQTDSGNRYLYVAHEVFTKSWELMPAREESPENSARLYCNQIFPRWGAAETIRTDRGPEYNNETMKECARVFGTTHLLGALGYPRFSGQTERGNETILAFLRKFCADHPRDWDTYLPGLYMVLHTSVSKVTGETPYYLNHGCNFKILLEIACKPKSTEPPPNVNTYVSDMVM